MNLNFSLANSVEDFSRNSFESLGGTAAVTDCYGRLKQIEKDPRWRVAYLEGSASGELVCATPLFACQTSRWPNPDLFEGSNPIATDTLVVGSTAAHRTTLYVDPERTDPRAYAHQVFSFVRDTDRTTVAFPFQESAAASWLNFAFESRITWVETEPTAMYESLDAPNTKQVRKYLRRDSRLLDDMSIEYSVNDWQDVARRASTMIAGHARAKGGRDVPELAEWRFDQWAKCEGVRVVVFQSKSLAAEAVSVGLIHGSALTLSEVGLPDPSECGEGERLALYVAVVSQAPQEFARQNSLISIDVGRGAIDFKKRRGATVTRTWTGIVSLPGLTTLESNDQRTTQKKDEVRTR
ncbi:hypothetical protein [Rudaeicoccus suwonensis]|uniref:Acetyltransferase (GNAT) family protein n=1 Tax=Rudaeicoccus suwonensis TaxID=657409 RepID=A0A561DVL8_9MICO|nr:hypothetical protein [Rudaeicoccus suwonensis]TWE07402.1 hypothetical protein BKA23_3416 [Rudaeicoccus suwonensis]